MWDWANAQSTIAMAEDEVSHRAYYAFGMGTDANDQRWIAPVGREDSNCARAMRTKARHSHFRANVGYRQLHPGSFAFRRRIEDDAASETGIQDREIHEEFDSHSGGQALSERRQRHRESASSATAAATSVQLDPSVVLFLEPQQFSSIACICPCAPARDFLDESLWRRYFETCESRCSASLELEPSGRPNSRFVRDRQLARDDTDSTTAPE